MKILIPVDGSEECEASIPVAQKLANAVDAHIYLLRVVEVRDAFSPVRFDPDTLRMMEDAAKYLSGLVSRFELPKGRTTYLVGRSDDAAKEIIGMVEREGIDLIIMASHCKGVLQQLTRGSVYYGVLTSKACPVLGVPLHTRKPAARRRTRDEVRV